MGGLAVALAVGGVFAFWAFRKRLLTRAAALLAGALAASIVGLGGAAWAVPALLFFVPSTLLSRLGKTPAGPARRNARQVLANGGVAWGLLLAAPWGGEALCFWGFVGAFAAAAADTWATEVGGRFGGRPRSLRTGRRVQAGASGAVTSVGTLAALAGAASVAVGAGPFATRFLLAEASPLAAVLLVTGAGFLGAAADSLAGAFWQARHYEAGRWLDAPVAKEHAPAAPAAGVAWLTNDGVNVLCTAVGAAAGALLGAVF